MLRQDVESERDPQTHAIIGAAMEVHCCLGHGFLEAVYHEALILELARRGIPFVSEVELPVSYKGERLKSSYRADFVCFESVIVEIKAISAIGPVEQAQVLNYLKLTGYHRGLLVNFGGARLAFKRLVWSRSAPDAGLHQDDMAEIGGSGPVKAQSVSSVTSVDNIEDKA